MHGSVALQMMYIAVTRTRTRTRNARSRTVQTEPTWRVYDHDTHRETDRERDRCCRTHARTGPAHPAQPYTEHSVRAVSEHLVLRDRFSGVSTRTAKSILARQSPATVPLERQAAAAGLTACMLRCEQLGCAATAASSCISILLLAARLVAVRRAAFRLAVHVVQLACTHPNTGCEAETKPVLECLM